MGRIYDADQGIRTGYYYGDMTAPERDRLIIKLRRLGWSQKNIARRLGMSQQGISKALRRIAEGRPGKDPRG